MENNSAVNWLIEKVKSPGWQDMYIWHKEQVFEQALEMEKQQKKDAYHEGKIDGYEFNYKEYNK